MKFSTEFPIGDITQKGTVISDIKGNISICFELKLPIIYSLSTEEYESLVENFSNFIELLGGNILIHKQDFYFRDYFAYTKDFYSGEINSSFIDRSYQTHFNERSYLKSNHYLYITKVNNGANTKNLISKEFGQTDEDVFRNHILTSANVLKPFIEISQLSVEELISLHGPINKFCTLSDCGMEELKDFDFSNNSIYLGSKQIHLYTIQNLHQFPTSNVKYHNKKNHLPVSNMFQFSYLLDVPHIVNQYIYVPEKLEFDLYLDSKEKLNRSYNLKGSNNDNISEIKIFREKLSGLGLIGVYYHFNILCFDDTKTNIDAKVNTAFNESGFKKKENTINRKDLFWSSFPTNGSRLVEERERLMSVITNLEASSFLNYETNFNNTGRSAKGVRLCDRLYGIPYLVDIFDEPKERGIINNKNAIVLSGSGGGKSFMVNGILLEQYQQGDHIFIIDASFSYKLQCAMNNGVYLTFDAENKIRFNPFYMGWLKNPDAKKIFEEDIDVEDSSISQYLEYLEEKMSLLSGIINVMTKNSEEDSSRFEETIYRKLLYNYFKDRTLRNLAEQMKFDDFYTFIEIELPKILEEHDIATEFNHKKFLLMLEPFKSGNALGYLLNSEDEKIKNLEHERFVVIDVQKIRGNKLLFSIISLLAMDLYNQKVAKLDIGIKKILCIDEAWQAISSPEMANFMKAQVKVIRKYGGITLFISQELDDFISSEIIKESIINNSDIKIFADMGKFLEKFESIKKILAITDNTENLIRSLNNNRREGAFYKEYCYVWGQQARVYAYETPLELKAIFETDPDEVQKILPQYKKYGVELTALNYANK